MWPLLYAAPQVQIHPRVEEAVNKNWVTHITSLSPAQQTGAYLALVLVQAPENQTLSTPRVTPMPWQSPLERKKLPRGTDTELFSHLAVNV